MMTLAGPWADEILDFWLTEIGDQGWWVRSTTTDQAIAQRFSALWEEKRDGKPEDFLSRADTALAALLLFDQFPRCMFRGDPKAYATDTLARDIAHGAVARGYDTQIGGPVRAFFYSPFVHSEKLGDQKLALKLFDQPGLEGNLEFARKRHAIIERFGRFPHRNAVLGRPNAPGEEAAMGLSDHW